MAADAPTRKLCDCGCGQPTLVSDRTDRKRGVVRGQPLRFIQGHRPGISGNARIFLESHIELDGETGCWKWTGVTVQTSSRSKQRYGKMNVRVGERTLNRYAHRVSYEIYVDLIPPGYHIHHLCGNGLCVNPEHLQCLPANSKAGKLGPTARLTASSAREIRDLFGYAYASIERAAETYGVSPEEIFRILSDEKRKDDGSET